MGNLAPYACAGSVEYIVHSRPVLGVKRDLASYCIRRMQTNRFMFIGDSQTFSQNSEQQQKNNYCYLKNCRRQYITLSGGCFFYPENFS